MSGNILNVNIAPSNDFTKSYDIIIEADLYNRLNETLKPILTRHKVAIVTDENVHRAQGERFYQGLKKAGISYEVIILPAGEGTKTFTQLENICTQLLKMGVERNDVVIAFGGGVVGDITGFACSMLRRGCRFVQVPTTLLAQVDSAVGGKTAINAQQGKNLIGAFYQPAMVLTDIDSLQTLPHRERKAGYSEIVKYGLLGDADFFAWLEHNAQDVLTLKPQAIIKAVYHSCAMKAAIVERDERENGERALLNLGHTFGHALEAALGFSDVLLHGEGVAAGMVMAFDYAVQKGICPPQDAIRVKKHLHAIGCPTSIADIKGAQDFSANDYMALMMQDKKVQNGKLTLILPRAIGSSYSAKDENTHNVHAFWANLLKTSH